MKNVYIFLLLLLFFIFVSEVNSQTTTGLQPNVQNTKLKPIEINLNFVPDGENSKLEIGIVCNDSMGKQTLFANILKYSAFPNMGEPNWLENYIETSWNPAQALMSFPSAEGISINCKKGAIYHFEYKFNWAWQTTFNSIYALVYIQNQESKEVIDVVRSNNILYSEFNQLVPSAYLTITPNKDTYFEYIITNPTKVNITYEVKLFCSNISWQLALDKSIIPVPAGFSDTFRLKIKTTPREQYGSISLTVTPKYLKNSYSVPETRTIVREVITDGIEFLGVSSDQFPADYYNDGKPPWHIYIRNACFAQPEIGPKFVFMNYDYWQKNFPNLDYKVLYLFAKSDNYASWGMQDKLEKAALDCIEKGKPLIVSSNAGLSVQAGKLTGYKPSANVTDFYKKIGVEYKGFIDLKYLHDTLSFRVVNNNSLNADIIDNNVIVNSAIGIDQRIAHRVDYIGITGANKETFPFLWFNRKGEPSKSYAGVATVIGNSKIIYTSYGLETIGGVGDTLLIRNFLNWVLDPTSVIDANKQNLIDVYPNPAKDYITVSLKPSEGFEPSEGSAISIYNTLGEMVMVVGTGRDLSAKISISDLPKGVYLVKVGTETAKFVKK
ncbi:MAG: T9SS type A sorting domain-containing protein [bacterium]